MNNTSIKETSTESTNSMIYSEDEQYLFSLSTGFFKTKVLSVALESKLFTYLSNKPRTFNELKEYLQFADRPAKIFLDVLIHMNLISLQHESDDTYGNTPLAEKYLVTSAISYGGETLQLFHTLYDACGDLHQVLQTGIPSSKTYSYFFDENARNIEEYSNLMYQSGNDIIMSLMQVYDFSDSGTVLDIGGGVGHFAINLLSEHPDLEVILFDLPAVCKKAEQRLAPFLLNDRITIHAGNFFTEELPANFDTAVMMRITHDWPREKVMGLCKKIYDSLPEKGRLIIYESFKNEDPGNPGDASFVSLLLMLISPGGECRTSKEVVQMLKEVGFSSVETVDSIYLYSAIIAEK